jgi:hypothetical protein
MVRFITTWGRGSNCYLGIVATALGNASISHVVLSGEFPGGWAVLRRTIHSRPSDLVTDKTDSTPAVERLVENGSPNKSSCSQECDFHGVPFFSPSETETDAKLTRFAPPA